MYIKFSPNEYVFRHRKGKLVAEGTGLSFFFLERNTSVCTIPLSNTDADFIFEETTKDFQTVSVQGQITYRITDYKKMAGSMDFTVNLKTKEYLNNPVVKLSKRIINIAEVMIKSHIGSITMKDSIQQSLSLAQQVLAEMQENDEIKDLGAVVTGFSILKITANKETTRALEATTREEILKLADDALYERRNASIEQERKVKENELNTEISIEEKKKKIRETEISTKRMILEKENELERIRLDNEVELENKRKELAALKLENAKMEAEAEAYRISAIMEAYTKISPEVIVALSNLSMDPDKMIAQAFEKLAVNSQKIGQLTITPDLLESVAGRKNHGA